MAWLFLFIAGILEVGWAYFMKESDGFSKMYPTIATFVLMFASFGLLSIAMKSLPLGTAYAVWTGIGALGAFIVGIIVLGEHTSLMRVASAGLILLGLIGLKLSSDH